MKKSKAKSRNHSEAKRIRKDLESKLTVSIGEIIEQFGKVKKSEKIIEKFAKKLAKNVSLKTKDNSLSAFIKEDSLLEEKVAELIPIKEVIRKPKAVKQKQPTLENK